MNIPAEASSLVLVSSMIFPSAEPHLLRESLFLLDLDPPYFSKSCLVGDEVPYFWPDTVLQVKVHVCIAYLRAHM